MAVIVGAVSLSGYLSSIVGAKTRAHLHHGDYMRPGQDSWDKKVYLRDLEDLTDDAFERRENKQKTTFFENVLMAHSEWTTEQKFQTTGWLKAKRDYMADKLERHFW